MSLVACFTYVSGLSWWLSSKEYTRQAGDLGSIPGLGRSSGEVNGKPLQYSCLGNSMDRGAWQATVYAVVELNMTEHIMQHIFNLFFLQVVQPIKD